jgi:YesN/AraC family two-component response regulator
MTEDYLFTLRQNNNVLTSKHNRYTPAFKHKHAFFEMIYVYSGTLKQEVGLEEIHLKEGEICIIPPEVEHSIHVFDDSIIINILIRKSTFNDTFLEILSEENILSSFFTKILYTNVFNKYIIFRDNTNPKIREFISNIIIEDMENKKYSSKIIDNLLMALFGYLLRNHENHVELPKELKKGSGQFSSILSYIQNNYKTITLEDLSTNFHFTVPYLSKMIKVNTGHTFKEIVQTMKLNKAVELLALSNMKIHEISEVVGYENNTHFIRTFKKVYGISPNAYRKNCKNVI